MGRIEIKVITNAKKEDIKNKGGRIVVYLNETPVKGKANKRLVKFIKEKTGYDVSIIKGETTNIKLIEFSGENLDFLKSLLKNDNK